MPSRRRCSCFMIVAMLHAGLTAVWTASAAAQAGRPGRAAPPQEHSLTTKDGVQIRVTYYPSPAGQQAVPVILLHDFNETRAVMEPLAQLLQSPTEELQDLMAGGAELAELEGSLGGTV